MAKMSKENAIRSYLDENPGEAGNMGSISFERNFKRWLRMKDIYVGAHGKNYQDNDDASGAAYTRSLGIRWGLIGKKVGNASPPRNAGWRRNVSTFSDECGADTPPRGGWGGDGMPFDSVRTQPVIPKISTRSIFIFALAMFLLIGGYKLLGSAVSGTKSLYHSAKGYFSNDYDPEIFVYKDVQYLGNRRFNKPDGLCICFDAYEGYTMAEFDGGAIRGYGSIYAPNGSTLEMGYFKKSLLSGTGMCRYGDSCYVANFKKGTPKGIGYRYLNGVEQLVKFKSSKGDKWTGEAEIVASRSGEQWVTPKGKILKAKNDVYKNIEYIEPGHIRMGNTEFNFSGGSRFTCDKVTLDWSPYQCAYTSYDKNGNLMFTMCYDVVGGSITGKYTYEKGGTYITSGYSASVAPQ